MFFQKEGLIFESEYKGVTKEKLLSDDEAFATFTQQWLSVEPLPPSKPLGVYPKESATRPLRSSDYREILRTLRKRHPLPPDREVPENIDQLLNQLCDFQIEIQQPSYHIPSYSRSIHAFLSAAAKLSGGIPFKESIESAYWIIDRDLLQQILSKIELTDSDRVV